MKNLLITLLFGIAVAAQAQTPTPTSTPTPTPTPLIFGKIPVATKMPDAWRITSGQLAPNGGGNLTPVVVATTGNIDLTAGGIPDPSLTDGVTVVVGERILVWQQSDVSEIGIYIVQSGSWTRAPDLPTLYWNPIAGGFDEPSTVDGITVATGSLGSAFSGTKFAFLAENAQFIPIAGGAVNSQFNYDLGIGVQLLNVDVASALNLDSNGTIVGSFNILPTDNPTFPPIDGMVFHDAGAWGDHYFAYRGTYGSGGAWVQLAETTAPTPTPTVTPTPTATATPTP